MAELLEEHFMYKDILKLIKYIRVFFTSRTLLVQGMHQDNEPQGGVKIMQDLPLSIIYSK